MATTDLNLVGRFVPRNAKIISVLLVLVAVVNSATLGYDSAMMNSLSILSQYTDYFHLNTATTGLNNGALWMGSVLGALCIQPVSDKFGRKNGILIACIIACFGTILQSAAHNTATFVIGRIFVGIGSELASGPAPTLIAETLPASLRGPVLGIYFTCFYVGSLVSAGINYRVVNISTTWAWRIPSILQALPSLLAVSLLPLVPESPRWLICKGRHEEARQIFAIMHGNNDINNKEAIDVYNEVVSVLKKEEEDHPENAWKELISTKPNLHRLFIVVSFGVMVELFGNFVISYYLGDMLTQAGITDATTQLQVNIILSCWSFVVAVIGSLLMDVVGRRPMTLSSIAGMIVTLYLFGGLSKKYGTSDNNSAVYGTIAVVFLFQGFYAWAITPMTSLYVTEFLPYRIRNVGLSVFRAVDSSFGLMASFAMSYAMSNLGWKFYIINASWNIIFFVIVYLYWPETRRIPLEEIAITFGDLSVQDLHRDDLSDVVESTTQVTDEKVA